MTYHASERIVKILCYVVLRYVMLCLLHYITLHYITLQNLVAYFLMITYGINVYIIAYSLFPATGASY